MQYGSKLVKLGLFQIIKIKLDFYQRFNRSVLEKYEGYDKQYISILLFPTGVSVKTI